MPDKYDVIVVGGGFAGAHAAWPLVKAGLSVAMIDGGISRPQKILHDMPDAGFDDFRSKYPEQRRVFLGNDLSGIMPRDPKKGHAGNMTSGSRAYASDKTEELLPVSGNVVVLQSLAKGGLGEVWSATCEFFDRAELDAVGIHSDLKENYQRIIERVGISGDSNKFQLQPAAKLDGNASRLLKKYHDNIDKFKQADISQPPLALLTQDLGERKATAYRDMDYWDDFGQSVYRPLYTIQELEKHGNFSYIPDSLVMTLNKDSNGIAVQADSLDGRQKKSYCAAKVVLAAGTPNTVRIILRSLGMYNNKIPFLTKPHVMMPCLQVGIIGKKADNKKYSLCQLVISDKNKYHGTTDCFAQLHSYKSLLLYKLTQYIPFSRPEALKLASVFAPAFMVADIRFSAPSLNNGFLSLRSAGRRDYLDIEYRDREEDKERHNRALRRIRRILFKLGLIPLKTIRTEYGTASHYAGGIVPTGSTESPLHVDDNGQLENIKDVYVADTSAWLKLPAKSPTLTIMANADRIGENLAKSIKRRIYRI